jgi:CubicO group peptidase (beta-lactamase class C family)
MAHGGTLRAVSERFYFPPPGASLEDQDQRAAQDVGLESEVVSKLNSQIPSGRWALWRHGYLIHVEGDFIQTTEVKFLRKTWHALTVGAALQQGRIQSLDQKISSWCEGLTGKHAKATWRHVITQTSGFDYPYDSFPAYAPGAIWTYSDKNPRCLCNALARVYGKQNYRDNYDDVVQTAYFDAIGMRGWKTSVREDGIRFHFDLEDMGRLGLLVLARGRWRDKEIVPRSFVESLERKQTHGVKVNYNGPDDGRVGLDPKGFPEAPYGFMTWVNTDGDYYPGADSRWAWGAGAGGSYVLWNHGNGIVFAGFGVDTRPTRQGIPHIIESSITGVNPLSQVKQPTASKRASSSSSAAREVLGVPPRGAFEREAVNGHADTNPFRDITFRTTLVSLEEKAVEFFGCYDGDGCGSETGNM